MPDFRQQYKENPLGFHGAKERRLLRAESRNRASRNQRSNAFNRNRNIKHSGSNTSQVQVEQPPVKEDRFVRLQRWKTEKERQRRNEQVKKKPPFTVGVVHHKLYSPAAKENSLVAAVKPRVNTNAPAPLRPAKKITKATEKRLRLKALQESLKAQAANPAKARVQKARQVKQSIAPVDYKFTAPAGLFELPLFGKSIITDVQEHIRNFALSPPKRRFSKRASTFALQLESTRGDENASPRLNLPTPKTRSARKSLGRPKKELNSSPQEKNASDETAAGLNTTFEKTEPINTMKGNMSATESERTPKADSSGDPALFSPYIVTSRGKSKARKEEQLRRGLGMSPVDGVPARAAVQQRLNMSIEDEGKTAHYFCFLLGKESERLRELCRRWQERKSEPEVTEDAQYLINQAIGQTNLLLNKKFESFRQLIDDCESGKSEMLVTCKDLEGFWDMMYREVKDCDARFLKLEKSRSENWAEEKPETIKPIARKKAAAKKKVVASKPSGIRALIMAARKEKMLASAQSNSENTSALKMKSPAVRTYARKSLSLSAARSRQTPVKSESARKSLVQQVRLSESSKKVRSPLAIMKISKMCRTPNPTVELTRCPNQEPTPGKSILKKSKDTRDLDCSVKSNYKVNFDDNVTLNEVPADEEVQTKLDLAAALERIESFDFDTSREQVELAVERKLNFDSDSSDESEDVLDKLEKREEELSKSRSFHDKDPKPLAALHETASEGDVGVKPTSRKSPRRQSTVPATLERSGSSLATKELLDNRNIGSGRRSRLRRENALDEESAEEEHNGSVRILRNRTISTQEPPRTPRTPRRKSSMIAPTSEHKENTTPRRRRRSSLKPPIKVEHHSKLDLEAAMHLISLNEQVTEKPRRSTRFSVKYTEDCTGCTSQKAKFPVTPHVARNRGKSSEKKRRGTFSEYTLPT